jgi:programmed cell death 6-interacting protein
VELFKGAQQRSGRPSYFQDYANKAQRNLTEAKKDNDFIYHERIPDVKLLPSIGKAMLAKSLPFPERLSQNFKGKGTFNTLKPLVLKRTFFNFWFFWDVMFCCCYIAPDLKG